MASLIRKSMGFSSGWQKSLLKYTILMTRQKLSYVLFAKKIDIFYCF